MEVSIKHIFSFRIDVKNKHFWIRLFGHGIGIKSLKRWSLTFSQRNGFQKYIKIGNIVIYKLIYYK